MKPETKPIDPSSLSREALEEEVRKARIRVEEAESIEADFLSAMTHELKTPLNAILGFTDILLGGVSGPLTPVQKRQLASVEKSAQRLIELVNDVLDLTRAQSGKLSLNLEEFDLSLSLHKVAALINPEGERRGISFSLHIEEGAERAIGDSGKVEQVLRHLFSNAQKFTLKGSVEVEAARVGNEVEVRVKDTGIGIRPEDMALLFKPFRQLDTGLARKFEGAGLGLSLSKLIIEAMGGRIWVESVPAEGSLFAIALPAPRCP